MLLLNGTKDEKVPLPVGRWTLANYTIDAGGFSGGARTALAATFTGVTPAVTVSAGATAKLPFGAPYRAMVTAKKIEEGKMALMLTILGAAGEQCTNCYVKGTRPPQPRFTIKDKDGKTVHQGNFEYG